MKKLSYDELARMFITETQITTPEPIYRKPLFEVVQEVCQEIEPKPLFCEFPEDLKVRTDNSSGSASAYTFTSSGATLSGFGTSTTTF